jgi:predicted N-acetyltransferase YhbS
VGLWEVGGEIAGVTTIEHPVLWHPGYGEIFVQRHPEHLHLLGEMVAHGERSYANPGTGRAHILAYEDDTPLLEVLESRGYVRNPTPASSHLELELGEVPPPDLPAGYRLLSMADECDLERRREVVGRAFNHTDPREWPSALAYRELQRAPDYRPELDLVIAAPDGTYAACAIVWYDELNRVGHLEPLGTRPEFRQRGLARELLHEGLRRLRRLGATRMPMTGGHDPFYAALGFRHRRRSFVWQKVVART